MAGAFAQAAIDMYEQILAVGASPLRVERQNLASETPASPGIERSREE
jgi:hypothetical protein